jgi:hypothetical protein
MPVRFLTGGACAGAVVSFPRCSDSGGSKFLVLSYWFLSSL